MGSLAAIFVTLTTAVVVTSCDRGARVERPRVIDAARFTRDVGVDASIRQPDATAALRSSPLPQRDPIAAWTLVATVPPPAGSDQPATRVAVHAPAEFDARSPLHLVVYFHGSRVRAPHFVEDGDVDNGYGGPRVVYFGGGSRHDDAMTNTILVVPQLPDSGERFRRAGSFAHFVRELLARTILPRLNLAGSVTEVGAITLVGHSAGGSEVEHIVANDEFGERVRNIVLFDPLVSSPRRYIDWIDRAPSRRLVCISNGVPSAIRANEEFLRVLRTTHDAIRFDETRGSLTEAIREHSVVVMRSPHIHGWLPMLYLTAVMRGLGLQPRDAPTPDLAESIARMPLRLAIGRTQHGSLAPSDPVLASRAVADDYVVTLAAGSEICVRTVGGDSRTEYGADLDVLTAVIREGRVLAIDDDRGGRFGSLVRFTPTVAGDYTVRVTTTGTGLRLGPYAVAVAPCE